MQRISDEELVSYKQQAGYAVRNDQASMLGNSLEFEKNTLSDAYGEKLDSNYSAIQEQTGNFLNNANSYLANQDYTSLVDSMQSGFSSAMTGTSIFSDKDQKALSKIYDSMKPDVESMAGLIDEYREMGQAVPQDVMTAFNDAVQVGAAAGDADAAWQVFANQMIADPASEALVQAIQDGTVNVPDELKTAIDRATTEIDPDPVTIEGMQAEVDDVEVNQDHVDQLIQDALGDLGTVEGEVDGDIQIKVEKGNCLSQIGEALGVDWHEIAEYNGIEDPYTIYPDMELKIPKEKVDTDASGVGEAAEEAAKSETGETIETEQGVKTTLTGIRYYVSSEKGKIYLRKRQEQTSMPILSLDSNIQSYDMSRSIYKTRTRLTLVTSKNAKKGSFVNSSLEKKIGKFADIQTVDEDVTKTELNQKISTFKKDTSIVDQELSVTATGDTRCVSGKCAYVQISPIGAKRIMFIEEDTHTFENGHHKMSLKLSYEKTK